MSFYVENVQADAGLVQINVVTPSGHYQYNASGLQSHFVSKKQRPGYRATLPSAQDASTDPGGWEWEFVDIDGSVTQRPVEVDDSQASADVPEHQNADGYDRLLHGYDRTASVSGTLGNASEVVLGDLSQDHDVKMDKQAKGPEFETAGDARPRSLLPINNVQIEAKASSTTKTNTEWKDA